ncbi:hypothetical protein [Bradyrhizobium yuanmingense]|uniref:hypothetical protein n=1 Tax=Bradyrhizobium yuanmingense TaxID=108015 RepID=UPI0035129F39
MSEVVYIKPNKVSKVSPPLLVSRDEARAILGGISLSHLRRLMQAGELQPVFLNPVQTRRRSGKLYFRYPDLEALVEKYAKRAAQ